MTYSTELPLLDLFTELRRHGLPLGVDDYTLLLSAIQSGFGIEGRQALKQLCCTLWVKSEADLRLFDWLYQLILAHPIVPPQDKTPTSPQQLEEAGPPALETPITEKLPEPSLSRSGFTSLSFESDESAQVVQAMRRSRINDKELIRPYFRRSIDYFPVTRRQMKQSWRHLRRMVREGPLDELDADGTVEKAARAGFVAELVQLPRRMNCAELVLLVDMDGSMVPFHALTRQLIETAQRGGRLEQAGVYYFHDYPDRYLYCDSARLEAQPVSEVITSIGERTAVLILSDAGAARGRYDPERVRRTAEFIRLLKQSNQHNAWLNPMPRIRWQHNTAREIATLLPMFEMSRSGLDDAISALRGQYPFSM